MDSEGGHRHHGGRGQPAGRGTRRARGTELRRCQCDPDEPRSTAKESWTSSSPRRETDRSRGAQDPRKPGRELEVDKAISPCSTPRKVLRARRVRRSVEHARAAEKEVRKDAENSRVGGGSPSEGPGGRTTDSRRSASDLGSRPRGHLDPRAEPLSAGGNRVRRGRYDDIWHELAETKEMAAAERRIEAAAKTSCRSSAGSR